MLLQEHVNITKPAANTDGLYGGLSVFRLADCATGTPGEVSVASFIRTDAYTPTKNFEWNLLGQLNNHSNSGENCASYFQANKHSNGHTWAQVVEICDLTNNPTATVAQEVDCWVTGPDTGTRRGIDVVVGDSKMIRQGVPSDASEASIGVSVGASTATPYARWTVAYAAQNFSYCGFYLKSSATRAIQLEGSYIVGLDLSTAQTQSAIRLAPGQRMTFEPTDMISWSWLDGRLRVQNGSKSVLEIDTTTGDIYKHGVKVL